MALLTPERREDLKRQIWAASVRGMDTQEIADSFGCSLDHVRRLLREYRKERAEEYRENDSDDDAGRAFLLDNIQHLRGRIDRTINYYVQQGKHVPIPPLYSSLIHLIDVEMKLRNLTPNKIVGENGGPIQITAVSDRQAMLEEIKARIAQEEKLSLPNAESQS